MGVCVNLLLLAVLVGAHWGILSGVHNIPEFDGGLPYKNIAQLLIVGADHTNSTRGPVNVPDVFVP